MRVLHLRAGIYSLDSVDAGVLLLDSLAPSTFFSADFSSFFLCGGVAAVPELERWSVE